MSQFMNGQSNWILNLSLSTGYIPPSTLNLTALKKNCSYWLAKGRRDINEPIFQ